MDGFFVPEQNEAKLQNQLAEEHACNDLKALEGCHLRGFCIAVSTGFAKSSPWQSCPPVFFIKTWELSKASRCPNRSDLKFQAVLQGVAFTGVQVLMGIT